MRAFRALLRRWTLSLLRLVAPGTAEDLNFVRQQRAASALGLLVDSGSGLLDDRVAAVEAQLAGVAADLAEAVQSRKATPFYEKERRVSWEAVYETPGNAGTRVSVKFHVADQTYNGVSLFAAKTLPHLSRVAIHGYGKGPVAEVGLQPAALRSSDFAREIFVLGNSGDHLPVLHELIDMAASRLRRGTRTGVYLHDLGLKYLLDLYYGIERSQEIHRRTYGSGADRIFDSSARLLSGMSGIRVIAELSGADLFVCHGKRAAELLTRELADMPRPVSVAELPHPILHEGGSSTDQRSECCPDSERLHAHLARVQQGLRYVGVFGIPYDWKRPGVAVEVARRLKAVGGSGIAGVVLAGYDAAALLAHQGVKLDPDDLVFSEACDACLLDLMASTAACIQLRSIVGGESSGILSQLEMLKVPTIATRTIDDHAYSCVTWVSAVASIDEIQQATLTALRSDARSDSADRKEGMPEGTDIAQYLGSLKDLSHDVADIDHGEVE